MEAPFLATGASPWAKCPPDLATGDPRATGHLEREHKTSLSHLLGQRRHHFCCVAQTSGAGWAAPGCEHQELGSWAILQPAATPVKSQPSRKCCCYCSRRWAAGLGLGLPFLRQALWPRAGACGQGAEDRRTGLASVPKELRSGGRASENRPVPTSSSVFSPLHGPVPLCCLGVCVLVSQPEPWRRP